MRLVALGDSIPFADPAKCDNCTGYPTLFARAASRALGVPVTVDNQAEQNNLDSTRLLAQVRTLAPMRAAIARADIVVLTIGHNDTPWIVNYDSCDGAASGPLDDQHLPWAT